MGRWVEPKRLRACEFEADVGMQILFYEDSTNVREFQEKFKMYEDKFPACTFLHLCLSLPSPTIL